MSRPSSPVLWVNFNRIILPINYHQIHIRPQNPLQPPLQILFTMTLFLLNPPDNNKTISRICCRGWKIFQGCYCRKVTSPLLSLNVLKIIHQTHFYIKPKPLPFNPLSFLRIKISYQLVLISRGNSSTSASYKNTPNPFMHTQPVARFSYFLPSFLYNTAKCF